MSANDLLVNLLDENNADDIQVKIADLGNGCWVVSNNCCIYAPGNLPPGEKLPLFFSALKTPSFGSQLVIKSHT